ncbi:MAG: hypothetical protein WD187_04040 [Candidatus Woykebacteria bacterium]
MVDSNMYGCALGICDVLGAPQDTYTFRGDNDPSPLLWVVVDLDSNRDPLKRQYKTLCCHHRGKAAKALESKGRSVTVMPLHAFLEKRAEFEAEAQAKRDQEEAEAAAFEDLWNTPTAEAPAVTTV